MLRVLGSILALDASAQADGPTWVHLVRAGEHHAATGSRKVSLTKADLVAAEAGFRAMMADRAWPRGAPLGYNHAEMAGAMDPDSTRAAGYITDLRLADAGESLEALVDWTADGRARVRAGEFQALSVEIAIEANSKTTGKPIGMAVIGATLTNRPFVPGLRAVAASETTKEPAMLRTAKLLGLAETPSDDTVFAALSERDAKIATLGEQIKVLSTDRDAAKAEVAALREADAKRALGVALSEGRLRDTAEERALFARLSEDEREIVMPKGRIGGTGKQVPAGAQSDVATLSERASAAAKISGRPAYAEFADLLRAQSTQAN